jgi:hypothetical protein
MTVTVNRPYITVGFKWIETAFPFPDHAEDVKAFNELRVQYRKVQALVKDMDQKLVSLREQSSKAHAELAPNPTADTVEKAEDIRQKLASSEVELKRSVKQLQDNLLQAVHAKLPPIAARLHKAIGQWLIELSSKLEQSEKALATQYEASGYVPSELVRALVYRSASFFDAARLNDRGVMSNISNPDSAMLALPPETVVAPSKK